MGCQMSKKENEIEEVEITLEPTLEELYQKWREELELEKNYKEKEKMSKPIRPSWISDTDLCKRLQFLRRKGDIMSHVVVEALAKHFREKFNLPPKKFEFVTVLAENKMKEIKKQLGSYKDHTGIKKSSSEALKLNWAEITQHWKEIHEECLLAFKKITKFKMSLSDALGPVSKKAWNFFCIDYDYEYGTYEETEESGAELLDRLKNASLHKEVKKDPQNLKKIAADVEIAENISSKIEELIKEYRKTVM